MTFSGFTAGGAAPVLTLLETLYASGGRVETIDNPSGLPNFPVGNTPAGTHDGNDTTYDQIGQGGDGFDAANVNLRAEYTIDTSAVTTAISFVRVTYRGAEAETTPSITCTLRPSINGTTRGTSRTLTSVFTTWTDDFATDPDDAAIWTAAKINAKKWGVFLTLVGGDTDGEGANRASEFYIEVWGLV